jgi:acyl-coenzyme A synthetase/AMP-(fatty) acid ligase
MKIEILDDNLNKRVYDSNDLKSYNTGVQYDHATSKERSILEILSAYQSDVKQVLYDQSNVAIKELVKTFNKEMFDEVDFSMLLFTSGTQGKPVGAFKTKENLESEILELVKIITPYHPKKVISAVPFIHIYGILTSVLLPLRLELDLFFKEHFLPHDLLSCITPHSIVVVTPLYIKSLLRLAECRDLSKSVFISSTAPLDSQIAKEFIAKFNTNLIQLFGSTETGGIAYKRKDEELWTPINGVETALDENSLLQINSPHVSPLLYENGFKNTNGMIKSFDYVEFSGEKFKIIGRNSQIFKVAGKRYSTLHVEEILETIKGIEKAFVTIVYTKGALKDESLCIYLQLRHGVSFKEVRKVLKEFIGNIKIPIEFKVVEKIPTTLLGKKIMPI